MLIGEWGSKKKISPFKFSSKYYDEETGLYYYGYRYYDPASTKWLSRDPLGEAGGINLTAFVGNDPVNFVDPLGLMPKETLEMLEEMQELTAKEEEMKYLASFTVGSILELQSISSQHGRKATSYEVQYWKLKGETDHIKMRLVNAEGGTAEQLKESLNKKLKEEQGVKKSWESHEALSQKYAAEFEKVRSGFLNLDIQKQEKVSKRIQQLQAKFNERAKELNELPPVREYELRIWTGGGVGHYIAGGGAVNCTVTDIMSGESSTYVIKYVGIGVGLPSLKGSSKPIRFTVYNPYGTTRQFEGTGYLGGASFEVVGGVKIGGGMKIPSGPFIPGKLIDLDRGSFDIGVSHNWARWTLK